MDKVEERLREVENEINAKKLDETRLAMDLLGGFQRSSKGNQIVVLVLIMLLFLSQLAWIFFTYKNNQDWLHKLDNLEWDIVQEEELTIDNNSDTEVDENGKIKIKNINNNATKKSNDNSKDDIIGDKNKEQ